MYFCLFADVVVLLQSVSNQVWAVPSRDPGVPYRAIYGSAITGISSQVTLHVTQLMLQLIFYKIPNTSSSLPKRRRQTAQTQIRLLLKNRTFENRKRKGLNFKTHFFLNFTVIIQDSLQNKVGLLIFEDFLLHFLSAESSH